MLSKFRIVPAEGFGNYRVFMDERELENVRSVHVDMGVDQVPSVTLEFIAGSVEMDLPVAKVEQKVKEPEDEAVFRTLYDAAQFDEMADDDLSMTPEEFEKDLAQGLAFARKEFKKDPMLMLWFNNKEGRFETFMKYVEDRMRKRYKEQKEGGETK